MKNKYFPAYFRPPTCAAIIGHNPQKLSWAMSSALFELAQMANIPFAEFSDAFTLWRQTTILSFDKAAQLCNERLLADLPLPWRREVK